MADLDNRRFDADATIRRSLRMFHSATATTAEAALPTSAKIAAVTGVTEPKLSMRSSASASQSHESEQRETAEDMVSSYVNSLNMAAIGSAAFGMIESLAQLTDSADSDGGLRLGRQRDVFSPSSIAKTRQANPDPAGLADVPHRYPTGVWTASHSPVAAPVGSRTVADFAAETEERVPLLSAMQQLVLSVSRSTSASAAQSAEHSEVSTPSSAEITPSSAETTPRGTATKPMPKPPDLRAHDASRCQWVAETQSLTELRLALQAHNPALHEDVASTAELSQKVRR